MAAAEIDWATYGLPASLITTQQSATAPSAPSPRGSASSAWNALHRLGDFDPSVSACASSASVNPSPMRKPATTEESQVPLSCADCGDLFTNKRDLNMHKKIHASDRKFQCLWCISTFRTLSHLKTHVSRKHPEADTGALTAQNTHVGKRGVVSSAAAITSTSNPNGNSALNKSEGNHFALHSVKVAGFKRDREYAQDEEEEPDEFTISSPILELQRASNQRHGSISSVCSEEQKSMASTIAKEQIEFMVPQISEFHADVLATVAMMEDTTHVNHQLLALFQGSGTDRRNYRCPVCFYCFKQPKGVDDHLPSHESGCIHECYFCMKGFDSSRELLDHTKSHLGIEQFQCSICNKTFRKKSGLKTHLVKNHAKKIRTSSPAPLISIPAQQSQISTSPSGRKSSIASSIEPPPNPEVAFHDEFANVV